jgi:hypothetical protein
LSIITKLFIVLHVVLTMVFVGATVVWVNRVEEYKKTLAVADQKAKSADAEAARSREAANMERTNAEIIRSQALRDMNEARRQLTDAQAQIRDRDVKAATSQQNIATSQANLQAATAALATAQKTVDTLQDQLKQSRTTGDKTQTENTQLLTANADLTSRLRTAMQQYRYSQEEVENLKTQLADAVARGGAPSATEPAGSASAAATPSGSELAINGEIREKRAINGVPYATISVGSQDQVRKGMKFNVIDRAKGDWLGYIVIDRVEPNEASGRLEGPHVDDMAAKNEVRTQL